MELSILDYGAVGDGHTMATQAIQSALDAASGKGFKVVIPAGTFLSGSLVIGPRTELHLAQGLPYWQVRIMPIMQPIMTLPH